jgi:hypothetical protein
MKFEKLTINQNPFNNKGRVKKIYQGDDFTLSMYIDAIEQKFAPTSRSEERKSFNDYSLIDYFQKYKNK